MNTETNENPEIRENESPTLVNPETYPADEKAEIIQPEPAPRSDAPEFDDVEAETTDYGEMFKDGSETDEETDDFDEFEETELPDFDFAEPVRIELKDGTACVFRIPDMGSEQRADSLRETTTITSPTKINGQHPTQDSTDHAKADIRYFLDNAERLENFAFNEGDEAQNFNARDVVRTEKHGSRTVNVTYAHLVPIKHKRAFVARLYGGKVEVEKPKAKENEVVALNAVRSVTIKQELGVEQTKDGKLTKPKNRIRYFFKEPISNHLGKWSRCWNGYKVAIKGGGSKSVSSFKTEAVCELFDLLIDNVTGAKFKGEKLDVKNSAHLAGIPSGVKRNMVAIAMQEFTGDVGND